jgi:hypothetical protein
MDLGSVYGSDTNQKTAYTSYMSQIKLFCFADKHCITSLADGVMDCIIKSSKKVNMLPNPDLMNCGYSNTKRGSKHRLYIARAYAFRTIQNAPDGRWTIKLLYSLTMKHNNLLRDFLTITTTRATEIYRLKPHLASRCNYHEHGEEEKCLYIQEINNALA